MRLLTSPRNNAGKDGTAMAIPIASRAGRRRRPALLSLSAAAMAGLLLAAPGPRIPAAQAGQPPAPPAAEAVANLGQQFRQVLADASLDTAARRQRLQSVLRRALDLSTLADFVCGRHAESLDPTQQRRFRRAFGAYVAKTYAGLLARQAVTDIAVVDSRRVTATTAAVATRIARPDGSQATWTWRLHRRDGRYRVVDLQTRGVSLAVTYRSAFSGPLAHGRFEELIAALEGDARDGTVDAERQALLRLLREFGDEQVALTAR